MFEKKNLIIGAFSGYDWNQLRFWCNSIKSSGFQGEKAIVVLGATGETVRKLAEEGFTVVANNIDPLTGNVVDANVLTGIPPHVARFIHIWDFLQQRPNRYGYVLTTDVRDVVFQTDPMKYLEDCDEAGFDFVASGEGLMYKDEPWGKQNYTQCFGEYFFELIKDTEIMNVGVFGGRQEAVEAMCLQIFQMSLGRPIPIVDQAVYNMIVRQYPWRKNIYFSSAFACQAGTMIDPSKIADFGPKLLCKKPIWDNENRVIRTDAGHIYPIFHQYDRTPYKNAIEQRYG